MAGIWKSGTEMPFSPRIKEMASRLGDSRQGVWKDETDILSDCCRHDATDSGNC